MSTVLAEKAVRFYDSTIGKKAVMAVTGLILFGFLIAHMLGNLQIFIGKEVMNHYAETLHGNPPLLWGVRIVLLVSVVLHMWAWLQLGAIKSAARPVAYAKTTSQTSVASRTMALSGPLIAIFVVLHLLHFTTGTIHPGKFVELHAYENVISGFTLPFILIYIAAMLLVRVHLAHGVWSMFQSVGFSHPRYTPLLKKFAAVFSWVLVLGFISIPLAVLFGILK
ncbi:MAG TPA: succinate dehydrogenase cytochrome b subunit [Terriglobia bacterium]|nr:succinate dehydrogenase cytochrome b subunit [Terriglobia bacterium]